MRRLRKFAVILLVLGAISPLPGCALVAGAGAGAYVNGDLEGRLEASPQRVVQASSIALS